MINVTEDKIVKNQKQTQTNGLKLTNS